MANQKVGIAVETTKLLLTEALMYERRSGVKGRYVEVPPDVLKTLLRVAMGGRKWEPTLEDEDGEADEGGGRGAERSDGADGAAAPDGVGVHDR